MLSHVRRFGGWWVILAVLAACSPGSGKDPDGSYLPPRDLIRANMLETELSALMQVTEVGNDEPTEADDLYGVWRIRAQVMKAYIGDFTGGQPLVFTWRYERGITAPAVGSRWIGSVKADGRGGWSVPDNGYLFPAHARLEKTYAGVATSIKKKR